MFFDFVRKYFGFGDSQPRYEVESSPPPSTGGDKCVVTHKRYFPSNFSQIESEVMRVHELMDEHMRSVISSFGFNFGSPFPGLGFEDDNNKQSKSWSFIQSFPPMPDTPIQPDLMPPPINQSPRDEMLKPQFRSRSSGQWSGEDQILDKRVNNEGLVPVIDDLKSSHDESVGYDQSIKPFSNFFGSDLFGNGRSGVSIFSNSTGSTSVRINGHTSVSVKIQEIVIHPDGTIEHSIITDDRNNAD